MTNNFPKYIPVGGVEYITPNMAQEYLSHNDNNPRKRIDMNAVRAYAKDIQAGNFFLNGEPIVFDANGDLKDGQHRLRAIIIANTPCYVYVIRGIDPSITTFDYGKQRRMYQELGVSSNYEVIANAIISNVFSLNHKQYGTIKQYIISHKDDMSFALRLSGKGVSQSPLGQKRDIYLWIYVMLRTGCADTSEIEQFMCIVNTGLPLERESSPAIILRNKLLSAPRMRKDRRQCLNTMAFAQLAFSDFCNGIARRRPYIVKTTEYVESLVKNVRALDGLE